MEYNSESDTKKIKSALLEIKDYDDYENAVIYEIEPTDIFLKAHKIIIDENYDYHVNSKDGCIDKLFFQLKDLYDKNKDIEEVKSFFNFFTKLDICFYTNIEQHYSTYGLYRMKYKYMSEAYDRNSHPTFGNDDPHPSIRMEEELRPLVYDILELKTPNEKDIDLVYLYIDLASGSLLVKPLLFLFDNTKDKILARRISLNYFIGKEGFPINLEKSKEYYNFSEHLDITHESILSLMKNNFFFFTHYNDILFHLFLQKDK